MLLSWIFRPNSTPYLLLVRLILLYGVSVYSPGIVRHLMPEAEEEEEELGTLVMTAVLWSCGMLLIFFKKS